MKNRTFRASRWIVLLFVVVLGWLHSETPTAGQAWKNLPVIPVVPLTPGNVFYVRSYGGKCLDFGPPPNPVFDPTTPVLGGGNPVFINDCNGSASQQVRVVELPGPGHLVNLYAGPGTRVLGKQLAPIVAFGSMRMQAYSSGSAQIPLEVQNYAAGSTGQIFALDGDSIILAADRNLVVEVQNNRGAKGTPLVLGHRDLDDSEFWTFSAADGSATRPTTGFVTVPAIPALDDGFEFAQAVRNAQPGTVIEVAPSASIDLSNQPDLHIGEGVTIRGNRRGLLPGPELRMPLDNVTMLEASGKDVRITGLRLRGPSRSIDGDGPNDPESNGIFAGDFPRVIIDHNEISDWRTHGVDAFGDDNADMQCYDHRDPRIYRPQNVRIARNFIHHNRKQERGYGIEAHQGGFPLVDGNTFVSNRHAIAADGRKCTSYLAYYNLVLFDSPLQHHLWYTHDFDVHGSNTLTFANVKDLSYGYGGQAGQYFEVARNTFLGTNRQNFDLRGEPTYLAELHHNVSLETLDGAIACSYCDGGINKLRIYDNNQFSAPNPVYNLGVGDFDGDGKDDLFLATGAAWYYSSAGQTEWRFLNVQTDGINNLRFGDFDGDGRTDVFTQHGSDWVVSWGGASQWEKINGSGPALSDFAVGDFDGDHRADIFYANGHEWFISYGGVGMFTHFAFATHRVSDLRFGDFNGDGKTDVFGVVGNDWMVVYGGSQYWTLLRSKLADSVAHLTVADFDGDGRADVAQLREEYFSDGQTISQRTFWDISRSGIFGWTKLHASTNLKTAAVGRFDNQPGTDLLFWNNTSGMLLGTLLYGDNRLFIGTPGTGAAAQHSREDMR